MLRRGKSISTSIIKERNFKTVNILVGKKYLDGKFCGECIHKGRVNYCNAYFKTSCMLYRADANDMILNSNRLKKCLNDEVIESNLLNAFNNTNLTWFKYSIAVDKKHNKYCHCYCNFLSNKYYPKCVLFNSILKTTPMRSQIKRCTQCINSETI